MVSIAPVTASPRQDYGRNLNYGRNPLEIWDYGLRDYGLARWCGITGYSLSLDRRWDYGITDYGIIC